MSDLAERARALGAQLDAGYDGGRTEVALAGVRSRLHRRRTWRVALASAAGLLCLLAGTFSAFHAWHGTSPIQASAGRPEGVLTLSDGSVVMPRDPTSRLVAKTVSPRLVELDLVAGGAHFDVAPNREREFRVNAGRVQVVVVGTKFSVERQGERTAVAVQAGRVRVAWERGQQLLDPGERGSFPPFEPAGPMAAGPRALPGEPEALAIQPRVPSHKASEARDKGKSSGPGTLDDLMLAADVARTSGHPADAARYLERALAARESDARAAVVAFTLGRVRLADLEDPAGAASAFAQARAAAPQGPLAEDALAREIEARFRAGDRIRAHELAEDYVKAYPSGGRLRAVRHFGGLP